MTKDGKKNLVLSAKRSTQGVHSNTPGARGYLVRGIGFILVIHLGKKQEGSRSKKTERKKERKQE